MIAKFEKLEISIRLANKMDNMDRTWKWFINPFFRMSNGKDLLGFINLENSKVRFGISISCKVVYHLVIATVAYFNTRDQGESDLSIMESCVAIFPLQIGLGI